MSEAFLKVVNMSISAGWLVLAVLALRLILKKAPKWVNVLLWGIVAVRLICPFSIESALSLIPSAETISPEIMMDPTPGITTGIPSLNSAINPIISGSFAPNPGDSANPLQILIPIASFVWILGVLLMLLYTVGSFLSLRHQLKIATRLRENIYQCVTVDSPFVLGILKPKIYLPYEMEEENLNHVVAHEQAHIRRKDHWWKPLGFLLLTIHWFNPLMWAAYILLCRDIELACDEKVIGSLGNAQRADYTEALVACSVNRRMIAACPIAFGEVGVKERVKNVMNYRKPGFWLIVIAVVACIVVAVCFLTDPLIDELKVLPEVHSHTYLATVYEYENKSLRYEESVWTTPDRYAIGEDMTLMEYADTGISSQYAAAELGVLEEVRLTKENFDNRFYDFKDRSARIRKNNARAWQLLKKNGDLYLLLQQKNGDMYLLLGDLNHGGEQVHVARWLIQLQIDTRSDFGLYAQSGHNAAPLSIFPSGTAVKSYKNAIHWLTIDPGDDFCPFRVYQNGKEIMGHFLCIDAKTYEVVANYIPSGLASQTYLFQNCDPDREYIVVMMPSEEPDAHIYSFGVRFVSDPAQPIDLEYYLTVGDEGVHQIIVSADGQEEAYSKEDGTPYQIGEVLHLNLLAGNTMRNGFQIKALGADGSQIWNYGMYTDIGIRNDEEIIIDDWIITPVVNSSVGVGIEGESDSVRMWFDYFESPEEMIWDGRLEINLPEFPDVTFRWYPEKIEAVTEEGITPLYTGMPIWNTYFCDLTGDGLPELCSTLSFGSGMIDNRVMIYDYASGVSYELSDRGYYDYSLRLDEVDGQLYVDKTLYPNGEAIASGPLVYRESCIQVDGVSTDRTTVPDVTFGGNLNLGLNAKIIDIDPFQRILYVTDLDQSANVFGERCAIDCTYAISRYNLLFVNYGDPNDVRTIDFSAFGVGDSVIIGMYDSELEKAFNGSAVAEQVQLATQKFSDTAVTIPSGMIPTDTYAVGLCNGALMLPMENGTYRYLLTETNPQGVTADELLFSFDETNIGEPIHHEVYSLKQYPDRSKVLLISTKNGPWLCEYSPPQRCSDTALSDAIAAGYPVTEDGIATHGQAAWQKFYEQTQKGKSASVTVAHYYTLNPTQCDSGYYEIFQQDYPCLHLDQLSYDGKQFTITSSDGSTRTYEYLMKYETPEYSVISSQEPESSYKYVLTHDNSYTYEELWTSVASSFYGAFIDHYTIYSESKR